MPIDSNDVDEPPAIPTSPKTASGTPPTTFLGRYVAGQGARDPELLLGFDNSRGARSWRGSHPHPVFSPDSERLYFNQSSDGRTRLKVWDLAE